MTCLSGTVTLSWLVLSLYEGISLLLAFTAVWWSWHALSTVSRVLCIKGPRLVRQGYIVNGGVLMPINELLIHRNIAPCFVKNKWVRAFVPSATAPTMYTTFAWYHSIIVAFNLTLGSHATNLEPNRTVTNLVFPGCGCPYAGTLWFLKGTP
jgi:hypothetical protein